MTSFSGAKGDNLIT